MFMGVFSTFERKGCTERVGTYHFMINYSKMWGERMQNVYGTYQNVNRVSETLFVKVFWTDPGIIKTVNQYFAPPVF